MPKPSPVVAQAIAESVQAFVRGVHCANPAHPDVTIPDDVVKWLQNDDDVRATFTKQLVNNRRNWTKDGPVVCRSAFHGGSLAALYGYWNQPKEVQKNDVERALKHISTICGVGKKIEWIFCPWHPNGDAAKVYEV
ncbi:MAG: hypothetical protein OXF27_02065 [Acidobacteria bacterium]|nr:hypothetical protein [Acidobacteriota bacterium]